jgi:hypothetical protein
MGDPARAWTTVATGHLPEVHGVGLETRRVAGVHGSVATSRRTWPGDSGCHDLLRFTQPAIATGDERRAKRSGSGSCCGARTVVVNWWATWLARQMRDRAERSGDAPVGTGGQLDAEVAPGCSPGCNNDGPPFGHTLEPGCRGAAESRADGDVGSLVRRSAELDAMQLALSRMS